MNKRIVINNLPIFSSYDVKIQKPPYIASGGFNAYIGKPPRGVCG